MPAAALIKVTQGATTDVPGRSVEGAISVQHVVFSNGDDTNVVSWKYELLYTPPGSVIVPFSQGPGIVSTFDIGAPDRPGSYRVRLTVTDAAGRQDVDIRNFAVPLPKTGIIIPPYQGNPPPLPLIGIGSKPEELNFGGQMTGWDAPDFGAVLMLHKALEVLDAMAVGSVKRQEVLAALRAPGTNYHAQFPAGAPINANAGFTMVFPRRTARLVFGAGTGAVTVTVFGTTVAGPAAVTAVWAGGAGTVELPLFLAWESITQVTSNADPADTVDLQTGKGFGLPVALVALEVLSVNQVIEVPAHVDLLTGSVTPTTTPNSVADFAVRYTPAGP
jgi:hypothetical protein